MAYFNYFPKTAYDIRGVEGNEQYDYVTNLLTRVLVKCHGWADVDGASHEALVGTCHFQKYLIRDGDRPDTLADQFYGDSELHWIILYANGSKFLNPYYDWPMTTHDLNKFIIKKYGVGNFSVTHHYEDANKYEVDSTSSGATPVTNYLYEETLNDTKRTIRIMQKEYVNLVINEFKRLVTR
jgi:hypothetical protein